MVNKKCITCSTNKDLSIKYRTKISKEPRYICKTCRNQYHHEHKPLPKKKTYTDLTAEMWDQMFKESLKRLSKRAYYTR